MKSEWYAGEAANNIKAGDKVLIEKREGEIAIVHARRVACQHLNTRFDVKGFLNAVCPDCGEGTTITQAVNTLLALAREVK